jgi:hypothetical protein
VKEHTDIIDDLATPVENRSASFQGAFLGVITRFSDTGAPIVGVPDEHREVAARSCVALCPDDVGKEVVLVRDSNAAGTMIVIGVVQSSAHKLAVQATADGRRVTLSASESITLKCGDASLVLKADGTVQVRGNRIVTHATGVNRIRGGSVELN